MLPDSFWADDIPKAAPIYTAPVVLVQTTSDKPEWIRLQPGQQRNLTIWSGPDGPVLFKKECRSNYGTRNETYERTFTVAASYNPGSPTAVVGFCGLSKRMLDNLRTMHSSGYSPNRTTYTLIRSKDRYGSYHLEVSAMGPRLVDLPEGALIKQRLDDLAARIQQGERFWK